MIAKLWLNAARPLILIGVLFAGMMVYAQERERPPETARRTTAQQSRLPRPILDTHQLMELFNKQLYMLLKQEMDNIDAGGDKKFQAIRDRGLQAAEMANLVALRPREKDQGQWQQLSLDLQQAGLDLAKAAEGQRKQQVTSAYQNLIQKCNDCHKQTAPDHAPTLEF